MQTWHTPITHKIGICRPIFLMINILLLLSTQISAQSKSSLTAHKSTQSEVKEKKNNQIRTVVIDAGHGGHDPGTVNFGKKEKDITLKIALKTGELISRMFPDVKIIYTREKDEFIELKQRANIANQAKADLFISIHCNAILTNQEGFYGTETYVQDPKVEGYNLEIAKRENSAILLEDNYKKNYEGFDPNTPETHIILSMFQNAHLEQSIKLAQAFEYESADFARRKSRGVKQAGFLVLKATTMPSVLIETGFLSNDNENKFLCSEEGQEKLAISIMRAFYRYKTCIEKDQCIMAIKNIPQVNPLPTKNAEVKTDITFRLQLLASPELIDTTSGKWKQVSKLEIIKEGSYYKYLSQPYPAIKEINSEKERLKKAGFEDMFTVAYENGNKIPVNEAQKKIQFQPK